MSERKVEIELTDGTVIQLSFDITRPVSELIKEANKDAGSFATISHLKYGNVLLAAHRSLDYYLGAGSQDPIRLSRAVQPPDPAPAAAPQRGAASTGAGGIDHAGGPTGPGAVLPPGTAALGLLLKRSFTERERKILEERFPFQLWMASHGQLGLHAAQDIMRSVDMSVRTQTIYTVRTKTGLYLNGPLYPSAVVSAVDWDGSPYCVKLVTVEQLERDMETAARIADLGPCPYLVLPTRRVDLGEHSAFVKTDPSRRAAYAMPAAGLSLRAVSTAHGLPVAPPLVVRAALGAAAALLACHTAGLALVDLKPAHCLLGGLGSVVCDIGSATPFQATPLTGGFTPAYTLSDTPPCASERHDLNTLAATLYELLTGTVPPSPDVLVGLSGVRRSMVAAALDTENVLDFVDRFAGPAATHGMFYQTSVLQWMVQRALPWFQAQLGEVAPELLPCSDILFDYFWASASRRHAG